MNLLKIAWFHIHDSLFPCVQKKHCVYRVVHTAGHGTYFAVAWHESVGLYSQVSIFLLGLMVVGLLLHEQE